jgi:hypothetical protein
MGKCRVCRHFLVRTEILYLVRDEVRNEGCATTAPRSFRSLRATQASAIASISTSAPDGSLATSTVERAGGVSPTCFE